MCAEAYSQKDVLSLEPLLKEWYKDKTGDDIDFSRPISFNQKIQWLKLYDSTPLKTELADKYLMKKWAIQKIGAKYVVPLLAVYDKAEDIDFENLPTSFVLKANHASGFNIIVKDKRNVNIDDIKKKFDKWMNTDFAYSCGFELHYRDIERKIIAEQYISEMEDDILDYKFMCFDGVPYTIWVDIGSGTENHRRNIYDLGWNLLDYTVHWPNIEFDIEQPNELRKMIELAKKLSEGFAFVRVDFYDINGNIYLGEMTFTSQSGYGKFSSNDINIEYGKLINLPNKYYLPPKRKI